MIHGKTIAITRSKQESQEFVELMTTNEAKPITLPTIELVSKGDKIVTTFLESVNDFNPDYSVFMSSKAVKLLFETARRLSMLDDLRLAVANTCVVAVGPKTKSSLEQEKIKVNHVPQKRFSSVGVGEIFTRIGAMGKRVIVPRSGASTPFLKDLLSKIGLEVKEIHLYDVRPSTDTSQWTEFRQLFSKSMVDGIIFTSASSVRAFFEIMSNEYNKEELKEQLEKIQVVSIGPFTANELEKFNVKSITSDTHTVGGAFDTMKNIFSV